ncbi:MAG: hypothetical protein BI182_05805 [Acetobacterium sp. MES1]|uniref:hypothetical protein n=1 Tax=Acetobacterium sp. MES1 TaxID=1899015 RepID=UPI000B9D357F|nr:hypothetical protein [Acetobacterium sp. MES1]OXS25244.1 MAG: hypothetical protein BI182_05805 [Acetobacterium sp. MES1]
MKKKAIIIGCAVAVVAIAVLLVLGFMNSDANRASKILEQYFAEQTDREEALSINDYENTGIVTDEAALEGFEITLSDSVKLEKLYLFTAKAEPETKSQFIVDVQNETVYEKEVRKPLPNSTVKFYQSLVPGSKTVVITLEAENPQDYKVSYGGVELTFNPEFNAFVGDVLATTPEDLKPE